MANEKEHSPSPDQADEARMVHFGKVDYSQASHARYYANHVAAAVTLFDIRLLLSDVDVVNDGVVARQTLTVLMTPELAELTRSMLERSLKNYTKTYGKSRLPNQALDSVGDAPV